MPKLTPEQALAAIHADFCFYREIYGRFDDNRERLIDYLRKLEPAIARALADAGLPEIRHGNLGAAPLFKQWAEEAKAEAERAEAEAAAAKKQGGKTAKTPAPSTGDVGLAVTPQPGASEPTAAVPPDETE